jgi:hypothetical protein
MLDDALVSRLLYHDDMMGRQERFLTTKTTATAAEPIWQGVGRKGDVFLFACVLTEC